MIDLSEYSKVIFFDTETTGLNPAENKIIEFSAYIENPATGKNETLNVMLRSETLDHIPDVVQKITHITPEILEREAINRDQFFKEFARNHLVDSEKVLFVAHNATFDMMFLHYAFMRAGYILDYRKYDVIDTLTVFKDRKEYPHKLKDALEFYKITDAENSHRAEDDVKALVSVFRAMEKEKDDVEHYINKVGFNPKYMPDADAVRVLRRVKFYPQPLSPMPIPVWFYIEHKIPATDRINWKHISEVEKELGRQTTSFERMRIQLLIGIYSITEIVGFLKQNNNYAMDYF